MTADEPPRGPAAGWRASSLVLLLLVLAAGSFQLDNEDVWLHARTGQWILEHGRVPSTNVLSEIHADYPSVHDKWLFQVAAHVLLDRLGPEAVIAARIVALLLLSFVLGATARRLGAGPWATLAVVALALLAARGRFMFRPDLLSLLLQALTLHLLLAADLTWRRAVLLLLLQVLWANLHGYFLLGWVSTGLVGVGHALAAWRARRARADSAAVHGRRAAALLVLAAAMAAACLLNPAGVAGWWHPFAILADLRAHLEFYTGAIAEFRPTFAPDPRQPWDRVAYLVLGAAAVLALGAQALAWWRRPGSEDGRARLVAVLLPCVLLLVVFGAMSRTLRRNIAPFAIAVAPATAAALTVRRRADAGERASATGPQAESAAAARSAEGTAARASPTGPPPARRALAALPACALCALIAFGELTDAISVHDGLLRRTGTGLNELAYPLTGIAFVAEHLPQADVFTAFRYGSTFTGLRWPAQVASTNGNTHGYPTAWLQRVMDALSGDDTLAFDLLVAEHGHDAALLPMAGPLAGRLLRDRSWTLVCLGRHEAVFVRVDSVPPEWLVQHDLEAQLAAGRVPPLPATPPCGRVLGLPRVCRAPTERDAAALFLQAGAVGPALEVARRGLSVAPDDPELLAQAGLLSLRVGEEAAARDLLRRSLHAGLLEPLAGQAAAALAAIGGG